MSHKDRLRRKAARRLARLGALSPRSRSTDPSSSPPRAPLTRSFLLRVRQARVRLGDQRHRPLTYFAPAPLETFTTPPVVGHEDPSTGTPKLERSEFC